MRGSRMGVHGAAALLAAWLVLTGESSAQAADESADFTRHVQAVFSRLGCNGGGCHGAVQGKNGFRLSLFATNAAFDFDEVVREGAGRRLNTLDPERSLLLLKATGEVAHGGGQRTTASSTEYKILRDWIAAGARFDPAASVGITSLEVTPAQTSANDKKPFQLKVMAKFSDGSTEDVTHLCTFTSLDSMVASVDDNGRVQPVGVGDTALLARYRDEAALATAFVPRAGAAVATDTIPPVNFIDERVAAKLKRLNLPVSPLCDDATFFRRVYLDVVGRLPKPDEVRAFLADQDPQKRAKKIDELLAQPDHAALWALKFCDLLGAANFGVYADGLDEHYDAPRFTAWVRTKLEQNLPYDQFARNIITATSREGRSLEEWAKEVEALSEGFTTPRTDLEVYAKRKTLDVYWQRKDATGVNGALQVAHSFMGLRLECARCHRHPHDVWQQDDLLSFANFFTHVRKVGFQGDNEKNFPEAGALFKSYNDQAKQLEEEAKKLKEQKGDKDKEKENAEKAKKLENRAKLFRDQVAKRVLHTEIRHVGKEAWASVSSPLGTQESKTFRLLGEAENLELAKDSDPRTIFADWLTKPDNPYFTKAIVNRIWAYYFGRGIIDPPDNLTSLSPPSHPELLDQLCAGFVKSGYDLRWLHRTILNSHTYQRSSVALPESAADRANYAYFYLRRLPAEVLVDAINDVTGTPEKFDMSYYKWPDDLRTVEIPYRPNNEYVNFLLDQFGKPARNPSAQCDCERDNESSVLQVLTLATHPRLQAKIADAAGNAARIAKEMDENNKRLDELFLLSLSRLPSDDERTACTAYLAEAKTPEEGLQGILWSLVNTKEFLVQH